MSSLFIFLLMLFLSAMLSGSESAVFSLPEAARERFSKRKNKRGKWILKWLASSNRTLAAILLGNLLVNTLLSWSGDGLVRSVIHATDFQLSLISLGVITLIILIFGEILPKVFAIRFSETWLYLWSPLLHAWFFFANVLANPLDKLTQRINNFFDSGKNDLSERDLVKAIQTAGQQGALHSDEQTILKRSVAFSYDTAYSAMVPLSQVVMLPHSSTFLKAKKIFLTQKEPIALVYHEKENQILGYLHIRNLIRGLYKKQASVKSKVEDIMFVPETMLLQDVLEQFISNTSEVAGVTDESGQLTGIITLKNILSEIIGEWDEEYQKTDEAEAKLIQKIDKSNFRILGELEIDEFNEYFNVHFQSKDSETMSGFLIEEIDRFPQKDTVLVLDNFTFYGMEMQDYKIKYFKMSQKK